MSRDKYASLVNTSAEQMYDLEEKLAAADGMISKWDTKTTNTMLFHSNPLEAAQYLAAVQNLQQLMENFSVIDSNSAEMIRAEQLMQMSMARLQNEFHNILLSNREPIDRSGRFSVHSSTEGSARRSSGFFSDDDEDGESGTPVSACQSIDRICDLDMIPLDAVVDLRNIVERMASSGYGGDCVRVFAVARKSVVEESLYNLGMEKMSLHDVHKMEWASLETKVKKWIYAAKISIRLLFAGEKRLCDQVFEDFTHLRASCFAEIAKEPTARLLRFAEAVAAGKRAPEKIFMVLDMYETLTDIILDSYRRHRAWPG
ncbi:exocyst complex component EXO70H1-like [Cryptomeria japonica]|uniref:exocyst complex component EXO70H1-like n=1 Tax=Cryptomeria japonica TaxID=3369 RepID=UPI0027D9FAB5|nr:exocyst complex component EXO70H1-like [Cryptomeria japonica]